MSQSKQPPSVRYIYSARSTLRTQEGDKRIAFKGYVAPEYAVHYLLRLFRSAEDCETFEELLSLMVQKLRNTSPQGRMQFFLNVANLHEIIGGCLDRANGFLGATTKGGYDWKAHEEEDQADIEVTASVLEGYNVIEPASKPEDDGLDFTGKGA